MIVTCPECATRYDVDDAAFSSGGRAVRCNHCGCEWYQIGPSAERAPAGGEIGLPAGLPASVDAGVGSGVGAEAYPPAAIGAAETYATREAPRVAAGGGPLREPEPRGEPQRLGLGSGAATAGPGRAASAGRGARRAPAARGGRRKGLGAVLLPTLGAGAVAAAAAVTAFAYGAFDLNTLSDVTTASVTPRDGAAYSVAPRTVNAEGVVFVEYKYDLVERAEGPALEVWGRVANNGDGATLSPTIEVVSRNAEGVALQRWLAQPEVESLGPGESAKFSSRMMYPLGPVHSVDFFIAAR